MAEVVFRPLAIAPPVVTPPRPPDAPPAPGVGGPGVQRPLSAGFGDLLKEAIATVNQAQQSAEEAARNFAVGQTRDITQTLISVEKANVTFQLMLQVRNRLLEAYQEVMRIQV
jgi:flagellar hook-basal body complex protein FliE